MRTLLTTVGTSLLTNARRALSCSEPTDLQLAQVLKRTDPAQASAETNSLSRLLREGDRLVFFHTQTPEGLRCARALARHYENTGVPARLVEVAHLNYRESQFKLRGLRSLVSSLMEALREERRAGREAAINATGGFKAEAALATVVGMLNGVPVYYIHELFQEVVALPALPLGWGYGLVAAHEEFFRWISQELRPTSQVDQRLRGLPAEIPPLLAEEESYSFLSAAGEALWEAYLEALEANSGVPVLLSSTAREFYEKAPEAIRQAFDRVFRRLRVREIRIPNTHQVGRGDAFVFPSGRYAERLFYTEEPNGVLHVYELCQHDDRYEALASRGVRRTDYGGFAPLP